MKCSYNYILLLKYGASNIFGCKAYLRNYESQAGNMRIHVYKFKFYLLILTNSYIKNVQNVK